MTFPLRARLLVAATTLGLGAAAHAQLPPDQLIAMGGAAQAVAEVCKGYSADQLRAMKADQLAQAGKMGVSAADFDKGFQAAHDKAAADIAALSAADRATMCKQMESLGNMPQ